MATSQIDLQTHPVEQLIASWPSRTKEAAETLVEIYGLPEVASESSMTWKHRGRWLRFTLYREASTS